MRMTATRAKMASLDHPMLAFLFEMVGFPPADASRS